MPDKFTVGTGRHYSALDGSRTGSARAHVSRCLCLRRSTCLLTLGTCLYLAWLAAGAAVFSFLEQPAENELRRRLTQNVGEFLQQHQCVPGAYQQWFRACQVHISSVLGRASLQVRISSVLGRAR